MRWTNNRWSRQSEELPIDRLIDAAIFVAKVLLDGDGYCVTIDEKTFVNQKSSILINRETGNDKSSEAMDDYLDKKLKDFKNRFDSLYKVLSDLKMKGKF